MRLRDWSERVERLKMCGKALTIIIPWECTFFNTAFDEGLIVVSGVVWCMEQVRCGGLPGI